MLLQISSAYSRHQHVSSDRPSNRWTDAFSGIFGLMFATDMQYIRPGFMVIWCACAVGVMLALGPVFTPVVTTMIPGKKGLPFPPVETRRPLSLEDTISSADVSLRGLNLWKCSLFECNGLPSSAEAVVSPQADVVKIKSSWTSGRMSSSHFNLAMANSQLSVRLPLIYGVAQAELMQVSPSLWSARCYGFNGVVAMPLLHILQQIFPALAHALTKSPWLFMGDSDKWEAASYSNDLQSQDPCNDGSLSSDNKDNDDAITLYDSSAPASHIQSFGNPSLTPAATHPDNSQFSTVISVGTPNII